MVLNHCMFLCSVMKINQTDNVLIVFFPEINLINPLTNYVMLQLALIQQCQAVNFCKLKTIFPHKKTLFDRDFGAKKSATNNERDHFELYKNSHFPLIPPLLSADSCGSSKCLSSY